MGEGDHQQQQSSAGEDHAGKDQPEHDSTKPPSPSQDGIHHDHSDLKARFTDQRDKIKTKTHPPGGYDPASLPELPPGQTVRITFHKAANLPPGDISTVSSDPFILATLRAPVPRRHRADPDLCHRTRTIRRSTSPEWQEEWVVANVPAAGFTLKCRIFDEDSPDRNDKLGNVTVKVAGLGSIRGGGEWSPPGRELAVKKRAGSRRAYVVQAATSVLSRSTGMTPSLWLSIEVLGRSEPPGSQMCTLGPTIFIKHYSPMMGRLAGTKVNKKEDDGRAGRKSSENKTQKYDFQANEMQLQGPVPEHLYHRYVEFRPMIGSMFSARSLRGKILNKALHKQHSRIYNFDKTTEWGRFEACSRDASLRLLRLAHFDEGGRLFTYVLTLDGLFRFCETGSEFGIDLLSKHTMHSDIATYIACSGEFFIRRLERPDASEDPNPQEETHPPDPDLGGGPPDADPPLDPAFYQLVIDNDSGTYRPDKSILPDLRVFMEKNFPGLGIVVMHCMDDELKKMKEEQKSVKKKEGRRINMVLNRSPSSSSMSSLESSLAQMEAHEGAKSKRERAIDAIENPAKAKESLVEGGKHMLGASHA